MKLSFQHANPDEGNEAYLLRVREGEAPASCLLVDAGAGTDLDALLGPDDRLVGICLTHAHLDHYAELAAAHRDDVPVLTSPGTAAVLDDVFDIATEQYDVEHTEALATAVEPLEDWFELTPTLAVRPVPAGHAPGAAGFLVRVEEGNTTHRLLATGDFTQRRAAGYPGFDPDTVGDIDALFLTAATDEGFEDGLTGALTAALEGGYSGARTLLATSGLTGVHAAYLLSAANERFDLQVRVRVVGQVAKLYRALEYDCDHVEALPEFDDSDRCLEAGVVTVAGPEIPHEGSSGRLFDELRDDPGARVVQVVGSGKTPLTDARCTLEQFACSNHPTRETLADTHDAIEPTETVMVHSHRGASGAFNELGSVVWGAGDTEEYTLYEEYCWQLPPWMNGSVAANAYGNGSADADSPPRGLERHDTPDLAAEGIDVDALADTLYLNASAATSPDAPVRSSTDGGSSEAGEEVTAPASQESDTVTLRPLAAGLLSTATGEEGPERLVADALESYVVALLSGEADGAEPTPFTVDIDAEPAVEELLAASASEAGIGSTSELLEAGLVAALDAEERTVSLPPDAVERLDAVLANGAYGFTDRSAVVETALRRSLVE